MRSEPEWLAHTGEYVPASENKCPEIYGDLSQKPGEEVMMEVRETQLDRWIDLCPGVWKC